MIINLISGRTIKRLTYNINNFPIDSKIYIGLEFSNIEINILKHLFNLPDKELKWFD